MKSILERMRKYAGSGGMRNPERAGPAPLLPERTSGTRMPIEDPYAEMRRVLAIAMLLG